MRIPLRQKHKNRDGITLLFVISMVVLFLLMGTTFMVISNDYYKSARRRARLATNLVDSESLLDECFYNLVRGPSLFDTASPLRGHSILADQYGYGVFGEIAGEIDPANGMDNDSGGDGSLAYNFDGPFVTIFVSAAAIDPAAATDPVPLRRVLAPTANVVPTTQPGYFDGFYNGRVLSITTGALKGFSGRIINSQLLQSTSGTPEREHRLAVTVLNEGQSWNNLAGTDQIIINGADFSGFGAGSLSDPETPPGNPFFDNLTDPDLDNTGTLGLNSLLPNQIGISAVAGVPAAPSAFPIPDNERFLNRDNYGYLASDQSPNEAYDAPDLQNMFLAGFDSMGNPIPSFHRDSLYASLNSTSGPVRSADQIRRFTFKPVFVQDDEYSTASEAYFAQYLDSQGTFDRDGQWMAGTTVNDRDNLDVDTDGDGQKDSVWIDIGLPTQIDARGHRFKPLVAYHVIDMDGRLNVNAHGSLAEVAMLADNAAAPTGGRGTGYGVAEISLSGVTTSTVAYNNLLLSRYGSDGFPGASTGTRLSEAQKQIGYPQGKFTGTGAGNKVSLVGGTFGTGADLFGQFSVQSVTPFTMPELSLPLNKREPDNPMQSNNLTLAEAVTLGARASVSPYLASFGVKGSVGDQMFDASELEALLRPSDVDTSQLTNRLQTLIAPGKQRTSVTTDSFEVNVPTTTRSLARRLVTYLLAQGGTTPAQRNFLVQNLIPQEILRGGKLNLNRPLGNGVDDDTDGVVDNEGAAAQRSRQYPGGTNGPTLDLDGGDDGGTGDQLARYLLAKDLYITALIACGPDAPANFQFGTRTNAMDNNHAYRRMVAQWAVNLVDFRDADSIMTGFEFDLEPFDATGWDADGVVSVPVGNIDVVWGAERPELLINETFAYHDRRNEDLSADNGATPEDTAANPNEDWDSGLRPESGAFFELYHPWAQRNNISQVLPGELGTGGVSLGRLSNVGSSPVWRLAFKRAHDDPAFLRGVYFTEAANLPPATDGIAGDRFFTTLATPTVAPGEHAVIGPSGNIGLAGGEYRTSFGRLASAAPGVNPTVTQRDEVRRIGLNITDQEVTRFEWDPAGGGGSGAFVDTVVETNVVVIDGADTGSRSLSISDPNGGYAAIVAGQANPVTPSSSVDGVRYDPAIDLPLDSGADPADINAIWNNGVTNNFRVAYLQRLADPTQPFEATLNPYLTIDTAGVDLVAFNGLTTNPANGNTTETGGGLRAVTDGETDLLAIERGSSKYDPTAGDATVARQNFFAAEEGAAITTDATPVAGDGHKLSIVFTETLGQRNDSIIGTAISLTRIGALTWNNRPFSSVNEIVNVPYLSPRWLTYYFNQGAVPGTPVPGGAMAIDPAFTAASESVEIYETMAFFGDTDNQHRHLLRFSQDNGVTATFGGLTHPAVDPTGAPTGVVAIATTDMTNRMVNVFDYLEVPSPFLGSETFLAVTGGVVQNGSGAFGFFAPNHGVPNFRVPGKVNINTIYDPDVWNAIRGGGSGMTLNQIIAMRSDSNGPTMTTIDGNSTTIPTDFPRPFTSVEGAQFVSHGLQPTNKGSGGTMFRTNAAGTLSEFDTPAASLSTHNIVGGGGGTFTLKDEVGTPYFRNELRQRLGSMLTTRSSVFSIWITVGYFHVDDYGRVGAEVGIEIGEVKRSRAFYIIDRSIPVAFEPGKNHNVDDAVLVRTIIE